VDPWVDPCNGLDDDCDGQTDEDHACVQGSHGSCTTSCGTSGTYTCTQSCTQGACQPPGEWCNGSDDNCDGYADNGAGCFRAVYRYRCGTDHMLSLSASTPGGCVQEGSRPYFYTHASQVSGGSFSSTPLYEVYNPGIPDHLYTHSWDEVQNVTANLGYTYQGTIGYCTTGSPAGTTPLYRSINTAVWDHMYTTDSNEANSGGYSLEGTQCRVWVSGI